MKIEYDKKVDAMYIKFVDAVYGESDEIERGIIVDYDKRGKIVGIEILDASKRFSSKARAAFTKPNQRVEATLSR